MDNKTFALIAFVVAVIFPLVGLILGIAALTRMRGKEGKGKGFAIAAIVIGSSWVLLALFVVIIAMIFLGDFALLSMK